MSDCPESVDMESGPEVSWMLVEAGGHAGMAGRGGGLTLFDNDAEGRVFALRHLSAVKFRGFRMDNVGEVMLSGNDFFRLGNFNLHMFVMDPENEGDN